MLAFSRSSAALRLLTETNENSELQLIAFDLSLQVVYMSFSGFCVLLSTTLVGKGTQAAGLTFYATEEKETSIKAPGKTT